MTRFLLLLFALSPLVSYCQNAYITNRGDSSISVINTETNVIISTIAVKPHPSAIVVSPDASRVYISYYNSAENTVTGIYTNTNSVFGEIALNIGSTYGGVLDISPDGSKVYVACRDTVFGIDAFTMKINDRIPTEKGNSIQGIAVSNDGKKVYVNGYNKIIVLDAIRDTVIKKIPVKGANFLQLAISPDNTKLYGADKLTGDLHATNLLTDTTVDIKVAPQNTNCVCVSSDGKRVYTSNYKDQTISVVDGTTNTLLTSIAVQGENPFGISLTPDDSKLYVVNFTSNNVNVINTSTYEIMDAITVGKNPSSLGRFIGGYSTIFPVTLSQFSASLLNHDVKLLWQTKNETNLSYFSVERSSDNVHFTAIDKLYAKGNTNSEQNYSFTDKTPDNTGARSLFYRLQMVDKNGSVSVSNTALVNMPTSNAISFRPNPVKDILTLTIGDYTGKAVVTITDISGKKYFAKNLEITKSIVLPVYISQLPSGIYILHVAAGNKWESKFIKE